MITVLKMIVLNMNVRPNGLEIQHRWGIIVTILFCNLER